VWSTISAARTPAAINPIRSFALDPSNECLPFRILDNCEPPLFPGRQFDGQPLLEEVLDVKKR
jgi:hypothetical protein